MVLLPPVGIETAICNIWEELHCKQEPLPCQQHVKVSWVKAGDGKQVQNITKFKFSMQFKLQLKRLNPSNLGIGMCIFIDFFSSSFFPLLIKPSAFI